MCRPLVRRNLPARKPVCLSTGAPIPGSNGAGSLYDVELYDIDYSYPLSVVTDLQSKGKKVLLHMPLAYSVKPIMLHALFFSRFPFLQHHIEFSAAS